MYTRMKSSHVAHVTLKIEHATATFHSTMQLFPSSV